MNDWVDSEPGARAIWSELGRLRRRATARPVRTLGITLIAVAAIVGWQARKSVPIATARVVLRITEGAVSTDSAPAPDRELRGFIRDVVLSTPNLRPIIESNHLYASTWARDPTLAIESMREDIEVDVWRNYFLVAREEGDGLRSAHVSITYRAKDPELAFAVTRELGELVVKTSEAHRLAEADEAVRRAQAAIDTSRAELQRRQEQLVRAQIEWDATHAAATNLELTDLKQSIERITIEQARRTQRLSDLQLGAQLERGELGLEFSIVDVGVIDKGSGTRSPTATALFALLLFALLLPLVAIAVAAFDTTVDDLDDIRRLGLQPLGHVGAFPDDNVGSLADRERRG